MKRILILLACTGALFLGACTSESKLPNPSGKGSIRAINAIPGSPEIRFLIEERILSTVTYKRSSTPTSYDDFEYNFNFEILPPGASEPTRVETLVHKVEKDREQAFVLTGDLLNPTVTVWMTDEREWDENATTFEMRFTHLVEDLGGVSVDVYLDEAVTPAVVVNKVATLAYGEVSGAQDFEAGEYIITITTAGDVNDVLFTSRATTIAARSAYLAMGFAGNENDSSPIILTIANDIGIDARLGDAATSPTVRFVHASYSLPTADVYDDDMLTNRIAAGLTHGNATGDIDVSGDLETYYWTQADSTAAILFEDDYSPPPAVHATLYAVGGTDSWLTIPELTDRASVTIYAKLNLFHAALNNDFIDVYLLDAGETIDAEDFPVLRAILSPGAAPTVAIEAGSYDLFVTNAGEQTSLTQDPIRIDAVNGDVFDILVLDTAADGTPELRLLPPPTP